MDLVLVAASWLHLVATVILLGFYAFLGLLLIPVLRPIVPDSAFGESMVAVYRRAVPMIIGSLVVFLATGVYLMGTDPRYGSLGQFSGSTTATLFLIKHIIVVGMIGLGVYIDGVVVRRIVAAEPDPQAAAVRRVRLAAQLMALLGAVVLLLTAAAQAS